jgi:CheY-like chemotaxis protein
MRDLEMLQILLQPAYEVTVEQSGTEAIEFASSESFDVILLDSMMPVVDGGEVIKQLNARGIAGPIILLSAAADRTSPPGNSAYSMLTRASRHRSARAEAATRRHGRRKWIGSPDRRSAAGARRSRRPRVSQAQSCRLLCVDEPPDRE